jgi:S-adenosylmethionine:tRNA ribosyltransferase-isomerase
MKLSDFSYELSKDRIAQEPLVERAGCRLLVFDRDKNRVEHFRFSDIGKLLSPSDLLILNNTRVIPARLSGKTEKGEVEVLVLREREKDVWEVLARPKKRLREGVVIDFGKAEAEAISLSPLLLKFRYSGSFDKVLEEIGKAPLPPYIKREPENSDREFYQTVYAERPGSVAAPTAGLHFTEELLRELEEKGVQVRYITLHIGPGTFISPRKEKVEDHKMSAELCEIPAETADAIIRKKRLIACGTSVVRCIESKDVIEAGSFWTELFIYPGYRFKWTDGLITNLHLPKSTPFILTSAFVGLSRLKELYEEAKREGYRFASYGDAMLII